MEKYKFEYLEELIAFASKNKDLTCLADIDGREYVEQYKKGVEQFEKGEFTLAIKEYEECFKINPIGINARFEIVECLIHMGKLAKAIDYLLEFHWMLIRNDDTARWYRRIGYIETEKGNYELAAACFIYSLNFENSPNAKEEIIYIIATAHIDVTMIDVEQKMKENGIPLYVEKKDVSAMYQ